MLTGSIPSSHVACMLHQERLDGMEAVRGTAGSEGLCSTLVARKVGGEEGQRQKVAERTYWIGVVRG